MKTLRKTILFLCAVWLCSCRQETAEHPVQELPLMNLSEMARMLSSLPLKAEHLEEVYDAVTSSSVNGYDEEYMMTDLLGSPGSGVGSRGVPTRAGGYTNPIRNLIQDYISSSIRTRASGISLDEYLHRISASDMQIYWPFHEKWDGSSLPIITFDPESEASSNIGYEMVEQPDGSREVREVVVTEALARTRPVWIVNSNDDSAYASYEMLQKQQAVLASPQTRASDSRVHVLVLKRFKMNRHYDSWFRGASEFFIKCGAVNSFTASTEAELRLFQPMVTDFMIVVRRDELYNFKTFDTIIMSDWSEQMENFAFMIVEDDGGTKTSWKAEAVVKVQSKSYGITLELPYNERDDIVWRGSLSSRFFESYSGEVGHFGDVDIMFDIR